MATVTSGVGCSKAKDIIEHLASGISVTTVSDTIGILIAETKQQTYEGRFGVQLRYRDQWMELKSATVPAGLIGIIDTIELIGKMHAIHTNGPAPKYGGPFR